eukprot:scaffold7316_cov123-Cylindrotheca_fusiformis.AAC.19
MVGKGRREDLNFGDVKEGEGTFLENAFVGFYAYYGLQTLTHAARLLLQMFGYLYVHAGANWSNCSTVENIYYRACYSQTEWDTGHVYGRDIFLQSSVIVAACMLNRT